MLIVASCVLVLLLLSAFFSGSETALTGASRALMHQMENDGNQRAAIVNRLLARKERLIGAILLGNNLVNILASALATSLLITLFGDAGVAYATLGMTLLVLIFSEVLPKTYAIKEANRAALAVAPIVAGLVWLLTPFVLTINGIVHGVFRVFGLNPDLAPSHREAELRGAIALYEDQTDGSGREERVMLQNVLDLNEVQVWEIMTHRRDLVTLDAEAPTAEVITKVLESPYTRLPIYRGNPDEVIGVLHAKELFRAVRAARNEGKSDAEALASVDLAAIAKEPWFIPDGTNLFDQLDAFRRRHEHFALVIDEYGSLQGIVTLEDILEEIVGDITDEHDVHVRGVRPQGDGSYLIRGKVTLRDLNRQFDWELPDEEASTVAGLILHEARRIPEVGQAFQFHGFRFEIMERRRNQITAIKVRPPQKDS
ncbi:MAG: HlyC/CorC family transporter [Rhodospirillales bacterium]